MRDANIRTFTPPPPRYTWREFLRDAAIGVAIFVVVVVVVVGVVGVAFLAWLRWVR